MHSARYATWTLLLSFFGLACAGYLTFLHLGLLRGELLGGPVCGTGVFNCHAVTAGAWGMWLGMPVALWGMFGYVAVFALSLLAVQSTEWAGHAFTLLVTLSTLFVAADLFLLVVMAAVIRFYCLFCLLTYGINGLLLLISVRASRCSWIDSLRRTPSALRWLWPSAERRAAALVWGILLVGGLGVAGVHVATTFVTRGTVGGLQQQIRDYVSKQPHDTIEISGDPVIGSPQAPIQVVEFSDFFCPACQRASKLNVVILANHRRNMALYFKHYPLDTTCNDKISRMVHPGACTVAAASECVHQQGRFWAFHDLVFEQGHAYALSNLDEDVKRLGVDWPRFHACMESGKGMEAVKQDIAEGNRRGVTSTPTYVVNGVSIAGGLTPTTFDDLVAALRQTENR